MENDVKKLPDNIHCDSSFLLTDWLLKNKLNNISYLSATPITPLLLSSKIQRKGHGFASKDVIRPTVQLFKNIQSKKRNGSPSPQRCKARAAPPLSPIKEYNKIFNHKEACEETLESYRKIHVYGKMKPDKVSRDKIESAVTLYRQKEQEKENTATRPAPNKKVEHNTSINKQRKKSPLRKPKPKIKAQKIEIQHKKPLDKEQLEHKKLSTKIEKNNSGDCKEGIKNEFMRFQTQVILNSNRREQEIFTSLNNKEAKDDCQKYVNLNTEKETSVKNTVNQKKNDITNNDINGSKGGTDDLNRPTRSEMIKSLRCKQNMVELLKSSSNNMMPPIIRKTRSVDYMIISPSIIGDQKEGDPDSTSKENKEEPVFKQSVDDLLQAYRIKYRNMIKLR